MLKAKHTTRFYLLAIACVLFTIDSYSQKQSAVPPATPDYALKSDSIALAKNKQHVTGLFARLFHKHSKKDTIKDTLAVKNKNVKKDTTVAFKKPHIRVFDFAKGSITWTSLYTQGINLNTGIGGFYNLANITQGFNVGGVPFIAQATGVEDNGQFMKDYSSYSVNFDSRAFLNAMQKRADNIALSKIAAERQHGKVNVNDSLKAFESLREKLTSPSYQAEINFAKIRLQKIEDSISKAETKDLSKGTKMNKGINDSTLVKSAEKDVQDSLHKEETGENKLPKDSLSKNKPDTTELHNLRMKIAEFEKLSKRYNQLFEMKKKYNSLAKEDSLAKKDETKYEREANSLNNPDNVKKLLEENKALQPYEKFLMGFQYFRMGRCTPEFSEFTLHNFMMNGISVGYKADNVYVSGGYGKQQAVINPYLMTGINVPTYKRTVEYARAGVGSEQSSNLYATVISISDPGSSATLPENNWLMDVSKKIVIAKDFDVEGEIAHSYFKYLSGKADSSLPSPLALNNNGMAYAFRAHGIVPGIKTDVKAEYLNTGESYVTLGNQFLLSGTKTYRVELAQKISKKISANVEAAHIIQNQSSITGIKGTDNWAAFGVKYQPKSTIDLEINYSPRQFQQQQGTVVANSLTSNIDQMSFTANMENEILGDELVSTLFVGNFQYNTPESGVYLAQNLNLSYYMLNEMFTLTSRSSVNFTGDESRNNWTGALSQFIGEGTYNMAIGKTFMFSSGCQWIEQPGVINDGAGIIGSISKMFGKWGRFSLQLNSRNDVNSLFDFNKGQLIISTSASILW